VRSGKAVRRLSTVLFTDIVGSTRIAAALGDERWRRLLTRHHAIVRRELRRFGGREIDTAGDGFLSVFEQPAGALRCAWAIGDAVRDIGLEIRAGVHTGEVETMGEKVGGLAVHIAARIISLAGPREILASATVRDLTAGSGLDFEDRGSHELKGIPGRWHVVAVVALAGAQATAPLGASEAEELRTRASEEPPRKSRARWLGPLAAAAALGLAALIVVPLTRSDRDPPSPAPATPPGGFLLELDPETGRVGRRVPLSAPGSLNRPAEIAVGEGGVWAIRLGLGRYPPGTALAHLDPATGDVEATIETRSVHNLHTYDLAVGARSVWVLGATGRAEDTGVAVAQINPATDEIVGEVEIGGGGPGGIAASGGSAWAVTNSGTVARLDIRRGQVVATSRVAETATGAAYGEGRVWVIDDFGNLLLGLDPTTLNVETRIELPGAPTGLAVGNGEVWVFDEFNATVTSVTTETGDVSPPIGGEVREPKDIAVAFGSVWLADADARSVVRIDPLTGTAASIPLDVSPSSIAPDLERGSIWIWGT